jgi:hypothetical protein
MCSDQHRHGISPQKYFFSASENKNRMHHHENIFFSSSALFFSSRDHHPGCHFAILVFLYSPGFIHTQISGESQIFGG